eukprot:4411-Pelagococcus_subviridis.AAC.3
MHDDPVVALVDEVRGPGDVVQPRRLPAPVVQLPRVRDEPHVHVVVLRELLNPRQHLTHVLRLRLPLRPLVIQLVVRVDEQPSDAVAHDRRAREP